MSDRSGDDRTDDDRLVPPVEPLPDLAWARLERQLWQAMDAPIEAPAAPTRRGLGRWRYPAIAAGLIAAAAVLALAWPRGPSTDGKLGEPVTRPSELPSRIATADAATEVSFGDADITVAPRSVLLLGGDVARGVELYLERGRASFEVAPRSRRTPFVVRAGAVRVSVIGTAFTVARDGDDVAVEVRRGLVEIVAGGRRDQVGAGQRWDRDGVHTGTLATMAPTTAPNLSPSPNPSPNPSLNPSPNLSPDPSPKLSPDPNPNPSPNPSPKPNRNPASATAPAFDPKAAFEAAAALEARDPTTAMAAYRRLAAGNGAWAANALYAAARLAFDRSERAVAAQLARDYLARFPRGGNAADARALLDRLGRDAP